MNKSSLIFIVIATLLIGGLIGINLSPDDQPVAESAPSAVVAASAKAGPGLNYQLINPSDFPVVQDEFGRAKPATVGQNLSVYSKEYKHETVSVNLELDGKTEYKVEMQQGDSVVYRWRVKDGEVYYDFHGHPKVEETEFFTRYLEGEGAEHAGSIIAPYKGQHGWFWLNISDQPITVELEVAGFYDQIVEIKLDEEYGG